MTPAELRRYIAENEAMAERLRKKAEGLDAQTVKLRAMLEEATTKGSLTELLMPVNVNRHVTNEHRMNIARGQKTDDRAFSVALAEHNLTQKRLAAQLKITPALLSMYRKGKRPIPQERAEKVQDLTGWKATARNWPGGIVS